MPERIQLRRTKGWRKPAGAINVARPSKWGNPFRVRHVDRPELGLYPAGFKVVGDAGFGERNHLWATETAAAARAVTLFRREATRPSWFDRIAELRGHDLCCWCAPEMPCHADVLLELANQEAA